MQFLLFLSNCTPHHCSPHGAGSRFLQGQSEICIGSYKRLRTTVSVGVPIIQKHMFKTWRSLFFIMGPFKRIDVYFFSVFILRCCTIWTSWETVSAWSSHGRNIPRALTSATGSTTSWTVDVTFDTFCPRRLLAEVWVVGSSRSGAKWLAISTSY